MNRSANCIKMLVILMARDTVTKEQLAAELHVNVRNILEYRKELEAAGYQIKISTGKYGGYTLHTDTIFPVLDFNPRELKAVQEADLYLQTHDDFYLQQEYRQALDKIMAAALVERSETGLYLQEERGKLSQEILEMIKTCEMAIQEQKAVDLYYKSMHAKRFTAVQIHPYEILYFKGSYYCLAYSLKAKDFRNFKFSEERMRDVRCSEHTFLRDANFDVKDHIGTMGLIQDEVYELDLLLYQEQALLLSEKCVGMHPMCEWVDETTLHYTTIMEGHMETVSFLLSLGACCEIQKPACLRKEIHGILKKMIKRYEVAKNG